MTYKFKKPLNTKILKISSFNIGLYDSLENPTNINKLLNYLFDESNLIIDILCLQGIQDLNISKLLYRKITTHANKIGCPVIIYPKFESKTSKSIDVLYDNIWKSSTEEKDKNTKFNNIVISRYPLINNGYCKKTKTVIANIDVDGYLISIYNIFLTEDLSNLSNEKTRMKEINNILNDVKNNSESLHDFNKKINNKYLIKDVHIICGNFNIIETRKNIINPEIIEKLKYMNAIDVSRYYSMISKKEEKFFNNIFNTKDCYTTILSYINNDKNNKENNANINLIVKDIYKNHGIGILLARVEKKYLINDYYPIESFFLLNKSEKTKNID